jgi:hypothetical protein
MRLSHDNSDLLIAIPGWRAERLGQGSGHPPHQILAYPAYRTDVLALVPLELPKSDYMSTRPSEASVSRALRRSGMTALTQFVMRSRGRSWSLGERTSDRLCDDALKSLRLKVHDPRPPPLPASPLERQSDERPER